MVKNRIACISLGQVIQKAVDKRSHVYCLLGYCLDGNLVKMV